MAPSSSASIVVDGVDKEFTLRYHRTLKQMAMAAARRQDISDSFLALDDVSFTIEQGESVGLIGANGSGKSTLLKILTRVMYPYAGRLEVAVTAYRTAMDCDERIGARPAVALGRLDVARTLARAGGRGPRRRGAARTRSPTASDRAVEGS